MVARRAAGLPPPPRAPPRADTAHCQLARMHFPRALLSCTMADDEPSAAMQELRRRIVDLERDTTLSAAEKAVRRQQIMSAGFAPKAAPPKAEKADTKGASCSCSRARVRRAAWRLTAGSGAHRFRALCRQGRRRAREHAGHDRRGAQVRLLLQPVRAPRDGARGARLAAMRGLKIRRTCRRPASTTSASAASPSGCSRARRRARRAARPSRSRCAKTRASTPRW
jgi:hypothetical protein